MKKRLFSLLFGLILVIGLLAGCGKSGGETPAPTGSSGAAPASEISGTLTLTMMGSAKPGMDVVAEDFRKAYPNINLEVEYITDITSLITELPLRLSSGTSADLTYVISGSSSVLSVGQFAASGHLQKLSNEPWVDAIYPAIKDLMMYDGEVYAMDLGFCPVCAIIYDKDYFAANNLSVPTTFDELCDLITKINAIGDRAPMSWAFGDATVNNNNTHVMAGNTVYVDNPNWLNDAKEGKVTFADTPGWRTTLEQVQKLLDLHAFSGGAAAMKQTDMIAEFASGGSAMMYGYGGLASNILAIDPDLNLGMFAFPAVKAEDTRVMICSAGGIAMPDTCSNVPAAKLFMEFVHSEEEADKYADNAAIISKHEAETGNLVGIYKDMEYVFNGGLTISDTTVVSPNTTFNSNFGTVVQGLATGQETVDSILAQLDGFFNE